MCICYHAHLSCSFYLHCHDGTRTCCWNLRHWCIISSLLSPYLVISQRSQPGTKPSDGLSNSCRAAIAPTLTRIRSSDRKSTREHNYHTTLSRADHLFKWGKTVRDSDFSFKLTSQEGADQVLSAYAQEVTKRAGTRKPYQQHVKTIQGYLCAATSLALDTGRNDPRFLQRYTYYSGNRNYAPLLACILYITKKWTPQKYPQQQLMSILIFHTIWNIVPSYKGAELGLDAVVRDTSILGTFTGSWVSAYV